MDFLDNLGDIFDSFEDFFNHHDSQYMLTDNDEITWLSPLNQQTMQTSQLQNAYVQHGRGAQQPQASQQTQQMFSSQQVQRLQQPLQSLQDQQSQPFEPGHAQSYLLTHGEQSFLGELPVGLQQMGDLFSSMEACGVDSEQAKTPSIYSPMRNVEQAEQAFDTRYGSFPGIAPAEHNFTTVHDPVPILQGAEQSSPANAGPTLCSPDLTREGRYGQMLYQQTEGNSMLPVSGQDHMGTETFATPDTHYASTNDPSQNLSNADSAQYEIMRMRRPRPMPARADDVPGKDPATDRSLSSCEDEIVITDRRPVARNSIGGQELGAPFQESATRAQDQPQSDTRQSPTASTSSPEQTPSPVKRSSNVPLYATHGITSAEDAMRIAYGSIGKRRKLKDRTSWQNVAENQHAWAKRFYDAILVRDDDGPPIKLDTKGLSMYHNQQSRFMTKLRGLVIQQGQEYDSVLPQICANCYLQVEAVIILHRDGVPKLDLDEASAGSRAQRQKVDMELTCSERLHDMINAARDLKSVAYDVAIGKNQHVFAYSPQGYVNGKLGNIQSNATRKGNKATNNAAGASPAEQGVDTPDEKPQLDNGGQVVQGQGTRRKRRASSRDSDKEWQETRSNVNDNGTGNAKRRRLNHG